MSKFPPRDKAGAKDMYWFAHGGMEANTDKNLTQQSNPHGDIEDENSYDSLTYRPISDHKDHSEEVKPAMQPRDLAAPHLTLNLGHHSNSTSVERDDKPRAGNFNSRKIAVDDRKKQLWEAEQERNDALMKKHMEREAALEAKRNAQRSHIAFAFGSSVPRNLEADKINQSGDFDKPSRFPTIITNSSQKSDEGYETYRAVEPLSISPLSSNGMYCLTGNTLVDGISPRSTFALSDSSYRERKAMSPPCWLVGSGAVIGDDLMTRSMTASMYAPRGRRKNDLTPTVPHGKIERTAPPRSAPSSFNRKRSVSMTRLDQLAQPRKHYVEAKKASSTASSGASSMQKDTVRSPTRPLSSASEKAGLPSSAQAPSVVHRRPRTSPRKPRPATIAGSVPDQTPSSEGKVSPIKKNYAPSKRPPSNVKKVEVSNVRNIHSKADESLKSSPRPNLEKPSSKPSTPRQSPPKKPVAKLSATPKVSLPKVSPAAKKPAVKKKADLQGPTVATQEAAVEVAKKPVISPPRSPTPESENNTDIDKNNSKRIISEEEAKAALAEKRRLAREQAEKEAEFERQRLENLRLEEEKRLHEEEEEQKRMEEEQLRLLEEHRKQEEEKLKKAIEEQERKEEEEKVKKEEDLRIKTEQEKKAKEEAERQRIELEEKLRKEEEERAERKKRLEKIMSRTRGKTSGHSPSGSISGSDQLDSGENPQDIDSSGANSLDSDQAEGVSLDDHNVKTEQSASVGDSLEANPTYEIDSETESINVNDVMPSSENASQENSMIIHLDEPQPEAGTLVYPIEETICEIVHKDEDSKENAKAEKETGDQQKVSADCVVSENDLIVASKVNESVLHNPLEPDFASKSDNSVSETDYFNSKIDSLPDPIMGDDPSEMVQDPEALQYEDGFAKPIESYSAENSNLVSFLDQAGPEVNVEMRSCDSTSSDLKLPDPIYEMTSSDEGSISSERLQKYTALDKNEFSNYTFNDRESMGGAPISDDVFSEQEVLHNPSSITSEISHDTFATEGSQYNASMFTGVTDQDLSKIGHEFASDEDLSKHQGEFHVETASFANSGDSVPSHEEVSMLDIDSVHKDTSVNPFSQDLEQVAMNASSDIVLDHPTSTLGNPFLASEAEDFKSTLNPIKNVSFTSKLEAHNIPDELQNNYQTSNAGEFSLSAFDDHTIHQNIAFHDQVSDNKNPTLLGEFSSSGIDCDVTVVNDKDNGSCIQIISTADQAQIASTDFSKSCLNNEQLNNLYGSSVGATTDSEDSSLDSNLSQIIDVNNSEKETVNGLNCMETSNGSSDRAPYNESSEQQYFFQVPSANGDVITKSNGKHLASEETILNGHRTQSSEHATNIIEEFPTYTQLDKVKGNDISSVDQSKDNIFENVDAIDYSKVSPDPFVSKGNTNQVSGNPFLM